MSMNLFAALICTVCVITNDVQANVPSKNPVVKAQGKNSATSPLGKAELNRAYRFLRKGNTEKARVSFERVLRLSPNQYTATLELGYLHARKKQWAEAVRYFEAANKRRPKDLRLHMDLGYALQNAGQFEAAAAHFSAVAASPGKLQEQARAALENVRRPVPVEVAIVAPAPAPPQMTLEQRRDESLNRGYAALREGNRQAARKNFRRALELDENNVPALKQLGYLAMEDGDLAMAAENFERAQQQSPNDHSLMLQRGFLYDRLQQPRKASSAFRSALLSDEPKIRLDARTALKNVMAANRRWYLDVFASPFYSTRFNNAIAFGQAKLGWKPRRDFPATFHLGASITRDVRSQGGTAPQIFSDNVGLFGVGMTLQPRRYPFYVTAEANLAVNFVERPGHTWNIRPDYRLITGIYRRWDSRPLERMFTDVDGSFGYYSRYDDNLIGYLQLREGLHLFDVQRSRFYGYLKGALGADTNRDFFNNVAEGGAGIEFRPSTAQNLGFRLEYVRGAYLGAEGVDPNPYRPNYNDFRVTMLFGKRF